MEETISGEIYRITYRNDQSGWAVFSITITGTGHPKNVTGILPQTCGVGTEVTCTGKIKKSGKYGDQLEADTIKPAEIDVTNHDGIVKLLTRLPGIGPVKAAKIVEKIGPEQSWGFALRSPEKFPVSLSVNFYEPIKITAAQLDGAHEALEYFYSVGMTSNQATKVLDKYKMPEIAMEVVHNNVYLLIKDIKGFGFLIVDGIALKAGIAPNSLERIKEAILFCLDDSESNKGNIWSYGGMLMDVAEELLKSNIIKLRLPCRAEDLPTKKDIRAMIYELGASGRVKISGKKVFSKKLLFAEKEIERSLQC